MEPVGAELEFKGGKSGNQGRGKGQGEQPPGTQCTRCGSRWHDDSQCPMSSDDKVHHEHSEIDYDENDSWDYEDETSVNAEDYWGKGKYRKGMDRK